MWQVSQHFSQKLIVLETTFIYYLDDIKDHLDNWNCIIMYLQGVDVKIKDEDQPLIMLYSL